MCKITKKEYNQQSKVLNIESKNLQELENMIKSINPILEKLIQLRDVTPERAEQYQIIINSLSDTFNGIYDLQRNVGQKQKFLEDRWNRRNWNGQDHNEWELVSNNID